MLPTEWYWTPYNNERCFLMFIYQYLFSLHKICSIAIIIQSCMALDTAWSMPLPPGNEEVVQLLIRFKCFGKWTNISLDYLDLPWIRYTVFDPLLQHIQIPPKLVGILFNRTNCQLQVGWIQHGVLFLRMLGEIIFIREKKTSLKIIG